VKQGNKGMKLALILYICAVKRLREFKKWIVEPLKKLSQK